MRLSRYILAFCACLLLSQAHAQLSAVESELCQEEARLLADLREQVAAAKARHRLMEDFLEGRVESTASLQEIFNLEIDPDREAKSTPWPKALNCLSLQEPYDIALKDLAWLQKSINGKRASLWVNLPPEMHQPLEHAWNSRRELRHALEAFRLALGDGADEPARQALAAAEQTHADLIAMRTQFLAILQRLTTSVSRADIDKLAVLWQRGFSYPDDARSPPPALLEQLPPRLRGLAKDYFTIAAVDIMKLRDVLNVTRGWLWTHHPADLQASVLADASDLPRLLLNEGQALRNSIALMIADTTLEYRRQSDGRSGWRALWEVLAYAFGLATFPLLLRFARALEEPASSLQGRMARRWHKQRLFAKFSRLTAGLPSLLPWVAGLLGLEVLAWLFRQADLVLLIPLIPFARLYILYGLLSLAGEWLLQRIAAQGGSFLNEREQREVSRHARRAAQLIVLPWLVKDLVVIALGPSLLLTLAQWLTFIICLYTLGWLLGKRRKEVAIALQTISPSRVDPLIDRLLNLRFLPLLAPLIAPPVLLALLFNFLHESMGDFDWYRKLLARGFKLRKPLDSPDGAPDWDETTFRDYDRFFTSEEAAERLPYIDNGLAAALRQRMDPWLAGNSEENSLLLTGVKGMGKSAAVLRLQDILQKEHPELRVAYVAVPPKTVTVEATTALLGGALDTDLAAGPAALVRGDQDRQPTVVILDNAQNFFLRRVGGLAGWESLLGFTNARLNNVFWLIVINAQSWAYLSNVYGHEYQIRNILRARAWSQSEIRSLVLSRNNLAGYRIKYDSILLASRGPQAGSIRNAEQLYFNLLWDACGGNPLRALYLWMTSVSAHGDTILVSLPMEVSGMALEALGDEFHFVYAALVIHENMTSEELVEVTAMPHGTVRSALKTGFDTGFIQRDREGRYRVTPLWYGAITRLLSRKNMLHE